VLIIMSGRPATGKSTIARALARETGAVHLRIDVSERRLTRVTRRAAPR
jgi:predicted kinase